MNIDINIDHYLSEENKLELIKDAFKEEVKRGLNRDSFGFISSNHKDKLKNYERVVSNSVYYYLETYVDKELNSNLQELISKNVNKTIKGKKDYSYNIFRGKGTFEKKDSIGQQILNKAIRDNESFIQNKVKESINKFFNNNDKDFLYDFIQEQVSIVILDKLKQ